MLKPQIIEKGILQPFLKYKRSRLFRMLNISAGVLTSAGMPVRQSEVIANERDRVRPLRINPGEIEIKYIDADAIYFCIPQNHFGHILTGTMAFAYILLDKTYQNHKIIFTPFPNTYNNVPCETTRKMLGYLGVKEENIMVIDEYTQFKSVVVLELSLRCVRLSRFRKRLFEIDKEFIDTFRTISQKFIDEKSPKKIYFSRSKFSVRPIMYEDKIEQIFRKNGYEIFYPEALSLEEQIKLVANADFYVCLQGTLEHHSLFMKDGATFIVMARKNARTERQVLIDQLQQTIKHIYLSANIQPFGDKIQPNIVGISKDFIEFFDEYGFTYDKKDCVLTNQEINDYIEKCSWRDIPLPRVFLKKLLNWFLLRHFDKLKTNIQSSPQ